MEICAESRSRELSIIACRRASKSAAKHCRRSRSSCARSCCASMRFCQISAVASCHTWPGCSSGRPSLPSAPLLGLKSHLVRPRTWLPSSDSVLWKASLCAMFISMASWNSLNASRCREALLSRSANTCELATSRSAKARFIMIPNSSRLALTSSSSVLRTCSMRASDIVDSVDGSSGARSCRTSSSSRLSSSKEVRCSCSCWRSSSTAWKPSLSAPWTVAVLAASATASFSAASSALSS
mmetsp:Transcript_100477/g.216724  ORF Transcript_100477/g.216724 Transcript_100477/m.216724 type:complete len:240 (+) Transcript_100477:798-1517(+)